MRLVGWLVGWVVAALVLTACGGPEVAAGPITPEAVEAIAREHLPEPVKAEEAEYDGSDPRGSVGARLSYADQHVDVVVGPPHAPDDFDTASACVDVVECAALGTDVDGGTLTLTWQEEVPEEDPGIIVLLMERKGEFSLVRWGGDIVVTGDPRDLDLDVSVDDAAALLEDARLRREVPE